jgi:uncharacterized protein (TIGR00369 family)
MTQLPHTLGCLVCGRDNPHGLHLDLHVDADTGTVSTQFTPTAHHIGFEGIIHGGVLATVLDEAMVWAATWGGRRFCVCAEMTVRYLRSAAVGQPLRVEARLTSDRKVIQCEGLIRETAGKTLTTASGKYIRLSKERNRDFVATLVENDATRAACETLRADASGFQEQNDVRPPREA